MTDKEKAQLEILRTANQNGKFALALMAMPPSTLMGDVFEEMMLAGLFRLIDVTLIRPEQGADPFLARVFLLSDEAKALLARLNAN